MQIKASCRYNADALKALMCFTLFKKAEAKKGLILWTLFCLAVSLVDVFGILSFKHDMLFRLGLVVTVIYLAFIYFCYFAVPKIQYKVMSAPEELVLEYAFYADRLKTFITKAGKTYEKEIEYSSLTKVVETSKHWFLYFSGKSR